MRKIFVASLVLLFAVTTAFAAPFTPQVLNIAGPLEYHYEFDGSTLSLPVTVTAANASVNLLIFTSNKGNAIGAVENGFLGWHYVNKIDTCLYISDAFQLTQGTTPITWDGFDENGSMVTPGDYTYYLWGFDNVGSKVRAAWTIATYRWYGPPSLYEFDETGAALANPIIWSRTDKWTLGSDPEASSQVETCSIPFGYGTGQYNTLLPTDHQYMFAQVGQTGQHGIAKFKWVPNGTGEVVTDFADNGYSWTTAYFHGGEDEAGIGTDGNYLYTNTGSIYNDAAESDARIWDFDGTLVKKIDTTDWWSEPENVAKGAQMNGGPNTITSRPGKVYLNCHCSCMKQMVDPTAAAEGDDSDLIVWANGNGDGTMDSNGFDKTDTTTRPWACNDYWTGTYSWGYDGDNHGFAYGIAYNFGAVSFGLLAPDGTGMQYRAYAGETTGFKFEMLVCDNGSAFDGIYCDNVHEDYAFSDPATYGFWFVGQSSFSGVLTSRIGVADAAPAAFAVAQNSPNPFNPTTTISFNLTKSAKTTVEVYNVAGQKVDTLVNANLSAGNHSVTWNAAKFSAGVYFYTVKSGDLSKTMKMTLLK